MLRNAPAQHIADIRPKPVPQILRDPQLAWPPKNMGGWMSTTMPTKLTRQPAKPNSPKGSPLQVKAIPPPATAAAEVEAAQHGRHVGMKRFGVCVYLQGWCTGSIERHGLSADVLEPAGPTWCPNSPCSALVVQLRHLSPWQWLHVLDRLHPVGD